MATTKTGWAACQNFSNLSSSSNSSSSSTTLYHGINTPGGLHSSTDKHLIPDLKQPKHHLIFVSPLVLIIRTHYQLQLEWAKIKFPYYESQLWAIWYGPYPMLHIIWCIWYGSYQLYLHRHEIKSPNNNFERDNWIHYPSPWPTQFIIHLHQT